MGRKGISSFVGPAAAYRPLVQDEDAAAALVAAAEADVRGTYGVADDEPLARAQLADALAARQPASEASDAHPPRWCASPWPATGVPPPQPAHVQSAIRRSDRSDATRRQRGPRTAPAEVGRRPPVCSNQRALPGEDAGNR